MRMEPIPACSDIGPEFDRLKAVSEISLNAKLVAFVEKAHSSLQSRGRFKQRDCYKRYKYQGVSFATTTSHVGATFEI